MATSTFSKNKPAPKPKYQLKYLIGAVVIVGVIGYLIFFGLTQTSQWSINVSELKAKGSAVVGQGVRVSGQLQANSVQKDVEDNKIAFVMTDGANQLPVTYNGVVPDTFERAIQVVAEGKLNPDGSFTASTVLAKCPSKYNDATNQPADYQWYDGNQISSVTGPQGQ